MVVKNVVFVIFPTTIAKKTNPLISAIGMRVLSMLVGLRPLITATKMLPKKTKKVSAPTIPRVAKISIYPL